MPCLGRDRITVGNGKNAPCAARVVLASIIAALALAGASATITVNTTNDPSMSGQCGPRDAINAANGQASVKRLHRRYRTRRHDRFRKWINPSHNHARQLSAQHRQRREALASAIPPD